MVVNWLLVWVTAPAPEAADCGTPGFYAEE